MNEISMRNFVKHVMSITIVFLVEQCHMISTPKMLLNNAIKQNNRRKTPYLVYILFKKVDKLTKFVFPLLSNERLLQQI